MSHIFRLLKTGDHPAAWNMGLDQAILEAVAADSAAPTLRFYGWRPAAISVGYFQGMEEEVDTQACARHGVDLVRRITGGGAVFHQTELTYSIVIPEGHPLAARSIMASYERLCGAVIAGLGLLGLDAHFAPINDIVVGAKKVSGNAQTRKLGCLLQHGTILLDVDVDLMFELLRVPSEKAKGKLIADVKERVTGLKQLLNRAVPFSEVEAAMEAGFMQNLDLAYDGGLTEAEEIRARELALSRFGDPAWNHRR